MDGVEGTLDENVEARAAAYKEAYDKRVEEKKTARDDLDAYFAAVEGRLDTGKADAMLVDDEEV